MTNSVNQVKELLSKSHNEDGSFGGKGPKNVDGVTDDELDAARGVLQGEQGDEEEEFEEGGDDINAADGSDDGQDDGAAEGVEGEQGAEEDVTITTSELAEAIGWEAGDVYEGIMVPLDDGQEPVTLGALKNGYQDQRRKITELEEQIENGTQQTQQANDWQQMSGEMMELVGMMQSLDRVEQNTNWQELEQMNPTEFMLRRQKLQDQRGKIGYAMQQLQQKEQALQGQQIAKNREKMLSLIDTWKDDSVRKADQDRMRSYLKTTYGFNDTEINRIQDPRTMKMIKDLVDMQGKVAESQAAVRKVRQAPRVLRGSGGRFESPNPDAVVNKIVKRAKETGARGDQLNAAKALLKRAQTGQSRSVQGRRPNRSTGRSR